MVQKDWGKFVDSLSQPSTPRPTTTTIPIKNDHSIPNDVFFKVVLLGDEETGKTALLYRYAKNYFPQEPSQTIVFDMDERKLRMFDGKVVKLCLLSHAGNEAFIKQISSTLKDAVGFVLVYDVNNLDSLRHCTSMWLPQIKKHATNQNCPIFLLGTKTDIRNESSVDPVEVRKLVSSLQCRSLEISAKESSESEVSALFEFITEVIYKRHLQNQIKPKTNQNTKYTSDSTTNTLEKPLINIETEDIGFIEIAAESDSENQDIHTIDPLLFGVDTTNEQLENFTAQIHDLSDGDNVAFTEVQLNEEDV